MRPQTAPRGSLTWKKRPWDLLPSSGTLAPLEEMWTPLIKGHLGPNSSWRPLPVGAVSFVLLSQYHGRGGHSATAPLCLPSPQAAPQVCCLFQRELQAAPGRELCRLWPPTFRVAWGNTGQSARFEFQVNSEYCFSVCPKHCIEHTYTENYLLFICNSDFTGHPAFLFAKLGKAIIQLQTVGHD